MPDLFLVRWLDHTSRECLAEDGISDYDTYDMACLPYTFVTTSVFGAQKLIEQALENDEMLDYDTVRHDKPDPSLFRWENHGSAPATTVTS